jgi:hypothetical protein
MISSQTICRVFRDSSLFPSAHSYTRSPAFTMFVDYGQSNPKFVFVLMLSVDSVMETASGAVTNCDFLSSEVKCVSLHIIF